MVTKTYSGDLGLRHFPWRLGLDPAGHRRAPAKASAWNAALNAGPAVLLPLATPASMAQVSG